MAVRNPQNPYNAGIDSNNYPTLTALSGTAGTADLAGTAEIFALGGNPTTGALYVQDLSGATGTSTVQMVSGTLNVGTVVIPSGSIIGTVLNTGTNINVITGTLLNTGTNVNVVTGTLLNTGTVVNVATGTQQLLTTLSNLTNGSVVVTIGTISKLPSDGTVTALAVGTIGGKAASGVAAVANPVQIAGTDSGGTIYSPLVTTGGILAAVMPTGTVTTGSLSNVAMLNAGTVVTASGTVTLLSTVTTLSNLTTGSINVLTGTQQLLTTLSNLTNGSINVLTGTQQLLTTVSNLTNGSINILTGTVTRLSNIGTLESGTVKLDPTPIPTTLTFGTLGTAGGSFFATISAASGAGTKHYITGVDIVAQSGTADVRVLAGSAIQGTGVLAAGFFPGPGGGISNIFTPAVVTGTNSELIYHFVGAGTAFIRVSYWKGI